MFALQNPMYPKEKLRLASVPVPRKVPKSSTVNFKADQASQTIT